MRSFLFAAALALAASSPVAARATPATSSEATGYDVDAYLRLRYGQTWETVSPRLRTRIESEIPDDKVAAAAIEAVRDTARAHDGFELTRASVLAHGALTPQLGVELHLDLSRLLREDDATEAVRELLASYHPAERVELSAGALVIPFSLHHVLEARTFELTQEGPTHQLLEHLGFSGRDVGAMVSVEALPERHLTLDVSATNGGATGSQHFRGPGLLAARLSSSPLEALDLATAVSFRPWPVDDWWEELRYRYRSRERGAAVSSSAALTLAPWRLVAEWTAGTRVDNDLKVPFAVRRGGARAFATAWAMATVRFALGGVTFHPAASAEWLDTDRDHPDQGELIQLAAAISADLDRHLRLTLEVSRRLVQPGTRDFTFDLVRYQTDATGGALQLQLGL